MEPLAVLGTAYSAYYLAEMFHWSGIISLIGCGITQVSDRIKRNMSGIISLIGCGITQVSDRIKQNMSGIISLIGCGITQVSDRIKRNMSGIISLIGCGITQVSDRIKRNKLGKGHTYVRAALRRISTTLSSSCRYNHNHAICGHW